MNAYTRKESYGANFEIGEGGIAHFRGLAPLNTSRQRLGTPFPPFSLAIKMRLQFEVDWSYFLDKSATLERVAILLSLKMPRVLTRLSNLDASRNPLVLCVQQDTRSDIPGHEEMAKILNFIKSFKVSFITLRHDFSLEIHLKDHARTWQTIAKGSVELTNGNYPMAQFALRAWNGGRSVSRRYKFDYNKACFEVLRREVNSGLSGEVLIDQDRQRPYWSIFLEDIEAQAYLNEAMKTQFGRRGGITLPFFLINWQRRHIEVWAYGKRPIPHRNICAAIEKHKMNIRLGLRAFHIDRIRHIDRYFAQRLEADMSSGQLPPCLERQLDLIMPHIHSYKRAENDFARVIITTSNPSTCVIDGTRGDDLLSLACGDSICLECLLNFLEASRNTREHMRCIRCYNSMTPFEIRIVLYAYMDDEAEATDVFERFLAARVDRAIAVQPHVLRHCPNPNCQILFVPSPRGEGQRHVCRGCSTEFCSGCSQDHLPAETACATIPPVQEIDGFRYINCQGFEGACGRSIEKNDGCNHMVCDACGNHLCWVCGQGFGSHHTAYEHYVLHESNEHGGPDDQQEEVDEDQDQDQDD